MHLLIKKNSYREITFKNSSSLPNIQLENETEYKRHERIRGSRANLSLPALPRGIPMIIENLNIPLQNDLYAFLFGCLALRERRGLCG